MFRLTAFALFCVAATPAIAQTEATPTPPAPVAPPPAEMAAVQTASMTFGQCLQTGVMGVPAAVTPEAGATNVLNGCATQRQALDQAIAALIAALPADRRAAAQEQARAQLAGVQAQIVAGITQMRAASAATPAPATAPAQ